MGNRLKFNSKSKKEVVDKKELEVANKELQIINEEREVENISTDYEVEGVYLQWMGLKPQTFDAFQYNQPHFHA